MGSLPVLRALVGTVMTSRILAPILVVLAALVPLATPAAAQVDMSGYWNREGDADNGYSREVVDLLGVPVSADGRAKALS